MRSAKNGMCAKRFPQVSSSFNAREPEGITTAACRHAACRINQSKEDSRGSQMSQYLSSEKIDPFEEKNEKCAHRSIQKSSSRFVSFFLLRVTSKSCVFRQFSFTFCIDICRSPSLQSQEDYASSLKRGERERARTHTFLSGFIFLMWCVAVCFIDLSLEKKKCLKKK